MANLNRLSFQVYDLDSFINIILIFNCELKMFKPHFIMLVY